MRPAGSACQPRILVLDNYDSFSYNVVQALGALGASPAVVRADRIDPDAIATDCFRGIVISPGPGVPENAGCSVPVVRRYSGVLPILGICLGHQAIAVAFGGAVVRSQAVHGKCAVIRHDGSRLFDRVPSPLRGARYHSLLIEEESLRATPLTVCARNEDYLVMAIMHREHHTYGLQFHPESVMSEHGAHIFSNFIALTEQAA